jgi:exonuclease III
VAYELGRQAAKKKTGNKSSSSVAYELGRQAAEMPPPPPPTADSLEGLKFSNRVSNVFRREEVNSVQDLIALSANDLLQMSQFGKTSLEEVISKLKSQDLRLSRSNSFKPKFGSYGRRHIGKPFEVSLPGSLTAAEIRLDAGNSIILVSAYAPSGVRSAHRIASDLGTLLQRFDTGKDQIIVAGDFNTYFGYGLNEVDAKENELFFERMENYGLMFAGPQVPKGLPSTLRKNSKMRSNIPKDSKNVVTHRARKNQKPGHQIDFVFASQAIAKSIDVTALNSPKEWGISDHCRVLIEFETHVEPGDQTIKIVSWNLNQKSLAWSDIEEMFREDFADIVLAQEVKDPKLTELDYSATERVTEVVTVLKEGDWTCGHTASGNLRKHSTAIMVNNRSFSEPNTFGTLESFNSYSESSNLLPFAPVMPQAENDEPVVNTAFTKWASISAAIDSGAINPMSTGLLDVLDRRTRYAVELHFGLTDGRKRSYREVGENLGVTGEAARFVVKRALNTLRDSASEVIDAELTQSMSDNPLAMLLQAVAELPPPADYTEQDS